MISAVSAVSENPLHTPSPFPSRAHFAKVRGRTGKDGGSTQWRITDCTDHTDRWHLICRLLAAPKRESNRLAALLERLPAERRRVECLDDVARRRWGPR